MMRVRLDGGAAHPRQLRALADISTDFARDTADITDRQNIQYHWIRVEDVPEIWRRLEAVGLQTTEACGDTPRVILGSPGRRHRGRRDHRPDPDDRRDQPTASSATPSCPTCRASSSRPSPGTRASTSSTRSTTSRSSGSCTPSSAPATTCGSAAGLSTAPRLAERLGVFVAPDEAADVWHGVISIFRDYGYRRLRNKARLEVPARRVGSGEVPRGPRDRVPRPRAPRRPGPAPATGPGDHVGVHPQKDGRLYVGAAPTVGRVTGDDPHRARRPRRGRRLATACASPRTRSSSSSTSPPPRSTRSSPASSALGLSVAPEPVPAPHHGVHRHRVLQARDRRDQGHRRHRDRRARAPARRRHRPARLR